MSLYSSIQVPAQDKQESNGRKKFVGLYDTHDYSSTDIPVTNSSPETIVMTGGSSDAVLQFAPSRRRTIHAQKKRLQPLEGGTTVSETTTVLDHEGEHKASVMPRTISMAPRLDVTNTFDDYADYVPPGVDATEQRNRAQIKKRQRKSKAAPSRNLPSWDEEYNPMNPVDLDDYLGSEESIAARVDWDAFKQANDLTVSRHASAAVPLAQVERSAQGKILATSGRSKLNFAPTLSNAVQLVSTSQAAATSIPTTSFTSLAPPPPPPPPPEPRHAQLPSESLKDSTATETAEDAYQRRAAMQSNLTNQQAVGHNQWINETNAKHSHDNSLVHPRPIEDSPPQNIQIEYSAAPVSFADALEDNTILEDQKQRNSQLDSDRGNAPGQKGFAQRHMASLGWTKGQGLGSSGTGRLAPLFVKPQKDGKTGRIIDRHKQSRGDSKEKLSRVVVLVGMIIPGTTFDEHLQQDVGDSCSQAYGKVERVKLDMETGRVLVKFTDTISALRCISTVEGREYNGKSISAKYYDETEFETGP